MNQKTGILLVNLGTPSKPSIMGLWKFLREFLSDRRVIDLPLLARAILLYGFILPTRPFKIKPAYESIWTEKGSPLLVFQQQLLKKIQYKLPHIPIELGMRYGNPSIKNALDSLKKNRCNNIICIPLFPQYATASTGSAVAKIYEEAAKWWDPPSIQIMMDFHNQSEFIELHTSLIHERLGQCKVDAIVYTFHGVPVRHLKKSGCMHASSCQQHSCPASSLANYRCYKSQCFETARLIHERTQVELPYFIAFQSRLGKTEWVKPYLDDELIRLRNLGYKNLLLVSPSFTADCLETLEELSIRAKETWSELCPGGSLNVTSSLNDKDAWALTLVSWICKKIQSDYINETYANPDEEVTIYN
jgi:ferrochelatase